MSDPPDQAANDPNSSRGRHRRGKLKAREPPARADPAGLSQRPSRGRREGATAKAERPLFSGEATFAGMQSTHGNQAVLRMLHSPQQVARMSMLRPSQGVMLQRKCACGGSAAQVTPSRARTLSCTWTPTTPASAPTTPRASSAPSPTISSPRRSRGLTWSSRRMTTPTTATPTPCAPSMPGRRPVSPRRPRRPA